MLFKSLRLLKFSIQGEKPKSFIDLLPELARKKSQNNHQSFIHNRQILESLSEQEIKESYCEVFKKQIDQNKSPQIMKSELMKSLHRSPKRDIKAKKQHTSQAFFNRDLYLKPKLTCDPYQMRIQDMSENQRKYIYLVDNLFVKVKTWGEFLNTNRKWSGMDFKTMKPQKIRNISLAMKKAQVEKMSIQNILLQAFIAAQMLEYKVEQGDENVNINIERLMMMVAAIPKFQLSHLPFLIRTVYELNRVSGKIEGSKYKELLIGLKRDLLLHVRAMFEQPNLEKQIKSNKVELLVNIYHLISILRKQKVPDELKKEWIRVLQSSEFRAPNNNSLILESILFLKSNQSFVHVPIINKNQLEGMKSIKNLEIMWDYLSKCDAKKSRDLKVMVAERLVALIKQNSKEGLDTYSSLIKKISNNTYHRLIDPDQK